MKRIIVAFLILAMFLGAFTACSGSTSKDTSKDTSTNTSGDSSDQKVAETTSAKPKVNEFGWEIPEETIEFTFYSAEMADPVEASKNSAEFDKWLKEKFNVVIHKIVYNVDPNERLNLMLASGDYPDAIANVSDAQVAAFKLQGKTVNLKPYIDQYGETIKSQLGDLYIRYFDENGEIHALPKYWGMLPIPDYSANIRYDYWLEAGSPKFETPDEFYEVLKQLQAAHPTNQAGQRTYALSDYGGGWAMIRCLTGAWGFKDQFLEGPNNSLTHWMNTPQGLEIVLYVNRIYRDGQMDPDFATNQFEQFMEKVSNHRVMGYIGSWWPCWSAGHLAWQRTDPNWTHEQRFINVVIKDPKAEAAYLTPKNTTGSYRAFITDKAKKPEDIVKWWNFEISDIGTKITGWGIPYPDKEDSDWYIKDGISYWKDYVIEGVTAGNYDESKYGNIIARHYWMVAGQQLLSNGDPRTGKWVNVWFDQNFNDLDPGKKILHENMKGTIFDNSYRYVYFAPDNPLTVKNQQINDMIITGWYNMVTADSAEECERLFYELQKKLNDAGLKEIEKFREEEFKKKIEQWGPIKE